MIIYPRAKLNLGLNIVEKREDGYHNLETVFYPIDIHDTLEVVESDHLSLSLSGVPLEGDTNNNLVVRAWLLLQKGHPLPPVDIRLYKAIPSQAGLGGGSSDGAFMLRLLNEMFQLNISQEELCEKAAMLGADCPIFILDAPAYAEGIGEQLTPIDLDLSRYHLLIVKPPIAVSTREAFAHIIPRPTTIKCREIVQQDICTWRDALRNDFEDSIFPQYPRLRRIKEQLYHHGALYAAMSGSGSSLYGFFEEDPVILDEWKDCYVKVI